MKTGVNIAFVRIKTVKMPGTNSIVDDLQPMLPGIKANRKSKNKQATQEEE